MQASKIDLNTLYAIKTEDGLRRFQPTAVVTRRVSSHKNPRDYSSIVEGHIVNDGNNRHLGDLITVGPELLLGEWTEFKELTERAEAEKARKKAEAAAQLAAREELAALLREIGGIVEPAVPWSKYNPTTGTIIRSSYGSVDIQDEGIAQVMDALKRLRGLTTLSIAS